MKEPAGHLVAVSMTVAAFLKVAMPVKEMSPPKSSIGWAASRLKGIQGNTAGTCGANRR